jgi:hypothetical protein
MWCSTSPTWNAVHASGLLKLLNKLDRVDVSSARTFLQKGQTIRQGNPDWPQVVDFSGERDPSVLALYGGLDDGNEAETSNTKPSIDM